MGRWRLTYNVGGIDIYSVATGDEVHFFLHILYFLINLFTGAQHDKPHTLLAILTPGKLNTDPRKYFIVYFHVYLYAYCLLARLALTYD